MMIFSAKGVVPPLLIMPLFFEFLDVNPMNFRLFYLLIFLSLITLFIIIPITDARGGRRGGKGKGKSNLQFAQVAEFSLIHTTLADNRVSDVRVILYKFLGQKCHF